MQQPLTPQPVNRAQRRRMRRTTAVAGAGLALTTSLVGLYPGGSRSAKAYLSSTAVTNTGPNCSVGTWVELKTAIYDFNYTVATNATRVCSTVTFANDISDAGVPTVIDGILDTINIPNGETFTLDGAGHQLSLEGQYGFGISAVPAALFPGVAAPSFVVTDLEVSGTPYSDRSSIFVNSFYTSYAGNVVEVTIQDSWIHGNASLTNPAVNIRMGGSPYYPLSSVATISGSEFSDNAFGAVSANGVSFTVTDSYFHDNSATYAEGRRAAGAAMALFGGSTTITDSTFSSNTTSNGGGAIEIETDGSLTISNSTFFDNSGADAASVHFYARYSSGYCYGYCPEAVGPAGVVPNLTIDHSTFFSGSASYVTATDPHMGNEVSIESNYGPATATLTNSVFWGDSASKPDVGWFINDCPNPTGAPAASLCPAVVGPVSISNSALQSVSDPVFDLAAGSNVTSGVSSSNMTFGDHGGSVLPRNQFAVSPPVELPYIPTVLPSNSSPLVDAAGTGGPVTDQRGVARPQGVAADIGSVEVEESTGDVTVVVTPPASQTITYGADPDLIPTDDLPDGVSWVTEPTCAVYDGETLITARPVPAGTYTVKCSGGVLPSGYVADYSATSSLTVNKAQATLTYTGTSGAVSGSTINLSASVSPNVCSSAGIVYTVNGQPASAGSFPVVDGEVYEIEVSYSDPNCEASSVYAIVLVGGTAAASSGGGWYNVSGVGRVNFGYTVQINKSRTGSTQVSGQMLWNSQNGKFRFKGVITGFVKTTTGCASGQVCGRIVGTGTLRTRNESGEWVVVGTNLTYRASVIDAGTASVCTGGRKPSCTTVNRPDFFGLDVSGPTFTGEQTVASAGWPTPVQLSGGNILIK